MCIAEKPVYFVAVAFTVFLLVLWVYATLLMRRVNVCFNEYRELLTIITTTVVVVVLQVVLRWIPAIGDSGFAYNTMNSMTDVLIGQTSLFVLVYKPAYHCYKDKDEYLKTFLRTLKRENRQTEYELANGEELARISSSYHSRKTYLGMGFLSHNRHATPLADSANSMTESTKSLAKVLYPVSHRPSDDIVVEFALSGGYQNEGPHRQIV
ncbi:hypothetical protein GGI04_003364 [Coemansia thaxteri]|uniref:Uncharacterized protein n=1 Tax=Coemansia thaxteri TaxID=2663907 RepID=A0A9W8EKM0_9FUNG|nr:hypothetical protein GGI04_003364 [Coemansia thaxteri]KAJ2006571.1 hypothetical protein H4R26_001292 [Coemansia thaxteri]KAJ2330240.1 hypothetical protein GGH92_009594 [Coemansia sp. RSA 2673]KAJ2470206.1 hypothetical protein GGI02_003083 [Coemansia sp. RSA 2322]KAJ2480566.1 hypothetical protein EV174_003694 [Coemansia sp. RSA 2320]